MKNIYFPVLLLSISISGCSEFYGYQPPAPVYGKNVTNPYETQEPMRSYPVRESYEPPESYQIPDPQQAPPPFVAEQPRQKRPVMSPAVIALVNESEKNSSAGDLESAVSALERALRIDPRNPALTYKLAEIRLRQEKPRLAEDLAKKSALLAANDLSLKRQSWLLISKARKLQHNYQGAKEARDKADSFTQH